MSESTNPKSKKSAGRSEESFTPETQSQRWVKYGSNVVLAVVLVIAIASLLTYLVQRNDRRIDTTSSGVYSLKPQTKAVLDDLKQKVTIVSLYTHPKAVQQTNPDGSPSATVISDPAQTVADLLDEYRRAGKNVDVQVIDPANELDKVARLHDQLVTDYGSQIQGYKTFLADWDKTAKEFSDRMTAQAAAVSKIAGGGGSAFGSDDDDSNTAVEVPGLQAEVIRVIKQSAKDLNALQEDLSRQRKEKYPDWKAIADNLKKYLSVLSQNSQAIAQQFGKYKDNSAVAPNVRAFMAENEPQFLATKTQADALIASEGKLGELKVDQLEQALKVQNPILVLGPTDWRVLQYNQIWSEDTDLKNMVGGKIRPRFSGEQQITAAIYSLTTTVKPKLCFVRPGGEPVTNAGFPPFIPAGPLSQIANRMKQYNFEIQEKDLSGTSAMQAQMRGRPAPPEPSDEEIKDSIWVVLDMPRSFGSGQEGAPPVPIAPKVKAHLDAGGSALVVFEYQAEDLKSALDSWGVDLHPEAMAMHEPLTLSEGSPTNIVEQAKTRPPLFVLEHYSDHPITKTVQNLASIWIPTMVVRTHEAKDATVSPLFLMDSAYPNLKVWGETDIENTKPDQPPTYDKDKDLAGPIYGGAAVEKKSGGRLVVMGSPIMLNGRIDISDPEIAQKQGRKVSLFPANGEISANSIFWLAHLEKMIAISPEAMDVSRISDMSTGALAFWRYGVLLILLPLGVLVSGLFVYASRRD